MTEKVEKTTAEIAQAEKFGLGDLVLSAILGAVVWGVQTLVEFPGLYPGVWGDAAVAAWVRPATHVMPGLWTQIAQQVFAVCGLNVGETVLRVMGHAALGLIAVCMYSIIREGLTFVMRMRPQVSRRRRMVLRLASLIGACAFVAADPVWTLGQFLSETTVEVLITLLALLGFLLFLRKGLLRYAYLGAALLGLLAAETPMGFVLPPLMISLYASVIKAMPNLESPLFKPAVMEVGKWHMTFIYFAAFVVGIALNCWTFVSHGGIGAINETLGYLPLAYVVGYWNQLMTAADLVAWILLVGICVTPFVVTAILFPAAADEERFLSYSMGLLIVFCSALALSQSSFLPALWFWTYFPVQSQYLLTIALFCSAFTLAGGVTTLGVDALCRDHQRLAKQMYGSDEDDFSAGLGTGSTRLLRRLSLVIVPLFIVGEMVPGLSKSTTRKMLAIVRDGVQEIVREAGDAKYLFTDGTLDVAIEFEAARQGRKLYCLSLMGEGGAMAGYLRTRAMSADKEDQFAFGYDSGMGLRSWIRDRPERLKDAAVLTGFDLWKRDGKGLPPMSGLLSRPAGYADENERQRGIAVSRDLAQRVLAVYDRHGGIKKCSDDAVTQAFVALQWRLARMCTYRGAAEGLLGHVEAAVAEEKSAQALNDLNPEYTRIIETIKKRREMLMQKVTPREGLQLALVRADFTLGKTYAEMLLEVEPDNPDANFAMGMHYLQVKQYPLAESYLKRCLIRRPDEPAVYNNLAMIQILQKRFDAAESNLAKALKILPNSAAVLDTKKALAEARKKAGPEAAKNAKGK